MKKYVQNPDVAWRTLDGKSVLVNLDTQATLLLNETGSVVWEAFSEPASEAGAVRAVLDSFDTSEETACADVRDFMRELLAKNLLVEAADD